MSNNIEIEENKILEHFNDLFAVKVNKHIKNKINILKMIYNRFEEVLTKPNETYLKLLHKDVEISDKLLSTFDKEQTQLFEKHIETINKMCALENEQLFYFGYLLTKILDDESKMSSD